MFRNIKFSIVSILLVLMIVQPVSAYWCVGNLGFARPCLPIRPFRSAVVYRPVFYRPCAPYRVYYRPLAYQTDCCPPVNYVANVTSSPSCSTPNYYPSGNSYYLNDCVSSEYPISNSAWANAPTVFGAPVVAHPPMMESIISENVVSESVPNAGNLPGVQPAPVPPPSTFSTKKPLLPVVKEEPKPALPKKIDPFEEAETKEAPITEPATSLDSTAPAWEGAKPADAARNPAAVDSNSTTPETTEPSKPGDAIFDDLDKPSTETVPSETAPSESIERPVEEPASTSSDVGDLFDDQPDTGPQAPNALRDLEEKAKAPPTNPLLKEPKPQPSPFPSIRPIADPLDATALKLQGGLESKTLRTWNDNSGTFAIQGRLVQLLNGKVRILKANGRTTTVAISRLSQVDLAFVNVQANAARAKYLVAK